MKWPILLPLLVFLPMIIAAPTPDDDEAIEFERARRGVVMLPNYDDDDDDLDEESMDMMRRRRRSSAYLSPSSKFLMWRDPDEEEDDYDEFERKRRSPFLYPTFANDIKRSLGSLQKRGIPFYFPFFNYQRGYHKRAAVLKRSLIDSFTRDDPTAFGYDKRALKKRTSNEDRKKKSI